MKNLEKRWMDPPAAPQKVRPWEGRSSDEEAEASRERLRSEEEQAISQSLRELRQA